MRFVEPYDPSAVRDRALEAEMVGKGIDGSSPSAPSDTLVIAVPPAAPLVGSVIRARHGLRSDTALVIGVNAQRVEVIWPSGEAALLPESRARSILSEAPTDVRSIPGRLMRLLERKGAEPFITEPARETVTRRIDDLLASEEHAVGLLLDRRPLVLSIDDCLALPIEPWRVRYQFLTHPGNADATLQLAQEIVDDNQAPLGVRVVVALKHGLEVRGIGEDVDAVFGAAQWTARRSELTAELAMSLLSVEVETAQRLLKAVANARELIHAYASARLVCRVEDGLQTGARVEIDSRTPLAVVDDLLDSAVDVTAVGSEAEEAIDGLGVSMQAYLLARTDPSALASDDVVRLGFGSEAVRRYLAGDDVVEPALTREIATSIKSLRSAMSGDQLALAGDLDRSARELVDLLVTKDGRHPSEELLADQSVWSKLIDAGVPGSATTGPLGASYAGKAALRRARTALLEWRWDEAREIAREGLRHSRSEDVRDELLNITACALWLQSRPEAALKALDTALEGAYTDALLVNAAVVATELEHESASRRLVKIAREAPSPDQRALAAERALVLWLDDDGRIWEETSEKLPTDIRDALRPIIREEISDERLIRILRVLAAHDSEWLGAQPNTAFGPNTGRTPTRLFRARAKGITEYVDALSAVMKAGSPDDWVVRERDMIVHAAIEVLLEQNDELSAAFFGLSLIDSEMPMRADQSIPLKCLTVTSIVSNVDTDDGEPNLRFIDLVEEAQRDLTQVDRDDGERFGGIVAVAGERLARSFLMARYNQFAPVIDAYNQVMSIVRSIPARNLNRFALRQAVGPIEEFCVDTHKLLLRLRPMVEDAEVRGAIKTMLDQAAEIGLRLKEVTR